MNIDDANKLYRAGRFDEAEATYRRLLNSPAAAQAQYGLGLISTVRGAHEEALRWLQQSFQTHPTASTAHHLARCYRTLGRTGEAAQAEAAEARLIARTRATAANAAPTAAGESERTVAAEITAGLAPTRGAALTPNRFQVQLIRSQLAPLRPVAAVALIWALLQWLATTHLLDSTSATTVATVAHALGLVLLPLAAVGAVYAVVSARTTRYTVTNHRLEILSGVLGRRQQVLWLWQFNPDVEFRQNLTQTLLNTGEIILQPAPPLLLPAAVPTGNTNGHTVSLIGLGTAAQMRDLAETLRPLALRERREMVANFIGNSGS